MDFLVKFDTVKSGWSNIYIEESEVIIYKRYSISFSDDQFFLANSSDPDEMPLNAAFHLGLHCLLKYAFSGFWSLKGLFELMLNVQVNCFQPL